MFSASAVFSVYGNCLEAARLPLMHPGHSLRIAQWPSTMDIWHTVNKGKFIEYLALFHMGPDLAYVILAQILFRKLFIQFLHGALRNVAAFWANLTAFLKDFTEVGWLNLYYFSKWMRKTYVIKKNWSGVAYPNKNREVNINL